MIVVIAQMRVAPGREEEFIAAARTAVKETLANEPECQAYTCTRDLSDPSQFVFVEQWPDNAALGAHAKTDHLRAFGRLAKDLVTEQVLHIHTVESTKTL